MRRWRSSACADSGPNNPNVSRERFCPENSLWNGTADHHHFRPIDRAKRACHRTARKLGNRATASRHLCPTDTSPYFAERLLPHSLTLRLRAALNDRRLTREAWPLTRQSPRRLSSGALPCCLRRPQGRLAAR